MSVTLQDEDWDTLVLSIIQGDCVLMLGPDVVTENVDGKAVPVINLFADHLRGKLRVVDEDAVAKGYTLAQVAQAYKADFQLNRLRTEAEGFFRRRRAPSSMLTNLGALPFRVVVDTTPGLQMEEVFRDFRKEAHTDWYRANADPRPLVHEATADRPIVYHLYGCLTDLKSLVLTENDLLDFLVAIVSEDPPLPEKIRSAITGKDSCFLFLGFGFKNWYLRILLHALSRNRADNRAENRSFALEHFDESLGRFAIQTTKLFFQEGHKIYFFDMEADEFSAELRKRVEERLNETASVQNVDVRTHSPLVFLCHASEDKERARELCTQMENAGIRTWLDKNDLQGGDAWNDRIERAIQKDVHYFVVLQSKALSAKTEGYVNKEINHALERQTAFHNRPFIIPLRIEKDCGSDDRFRNIQWIDFWDSSGFEKLVRTIMRDRELQRRGA